MCDTATIIITNRTQPTPRSYSPPHTRNSEGSTRKSPKRGAKNKANERISAQVLSDSEDEKDEEDEEEEEEMENGRTEAKETNADAKPSPRRTLARKANESSEDEEEEEEAQPTPRGRRSLRASRKPLFDMSDDALLFSDDDRAAPIHTATATTTTAVAVSVTARERPAASDNQAVDHTWRAKAFATVLGAFILAVGVYLASTK